MPQKTHFRESCDRSHADPGDFVTINSTDVAGGGYQINRGALLGHADSAYTIDFTHFQKFRGFEPRTPSRWVPLTFSARITSQPAARSAHSWSMVETRA
jgi:hypothetical protein